MRHIVIYLLLAAFSVSVAKANPVLPLDSAAVSPPVRPSAIEKLSRLLTFQTVSSDDSVTINAASFLDLHAYLEEAFPLVHERLNKITINNYSLLYTWPGTQTDLKPVLLSAHLDVVPVEQATLVDWEQLPFGGNVQEGFIWGRGAMDDKYRVIAILEAIEQLLQAGNNPVRTIYIALGHDEEKGGEDGAARISQYLQEQGVQLEAVLDEGMAVAENIIPRLKEPVAFVGTASKGNLNLQLTVKGEGGHSSVPPSESPVTVLSKAITQLQDHPFEARMTPTTKETFRLLAGQMGGKYKLAMRHYWLFKGRLMKRMGEDQATNALIRTQMAPTMLTAGEKDNVMPRVAKAVINFRILTGETSETVLRHVRDAIQDDRVEIATYGVYSAPSAPSSTSSWSYAALSQSIRETFPEVCAVVPALFPGSTDAKHYAALSDNIYRFAPQIVDRENILLVHNVNERLSVDVFGKCIVFYNSLIRNMGGSAPQEVALKD